MYTPEHFRVADLGLAYRLIEENPFGLLVCPVAGEVIPELVHLPFVLDRAAEKLRCHVARANPIARSLADGDPVLAVFTGPHAYVSPRFYEDPTRNVPTWNYAAVHVHARARKVAPRDEVLRDLAAMVDAYEAGATPPWSLREPDPAYLEKLLGGVTAYELSIERLEPKFKMSQNRPLADRARVVTALRGRNAAGDAAVALLVETLNGLRAE